MKYMSLSEYEQIFILIKEKGKFRENNSKASAYVKGKRTWRSIDEQIPLDIFDE